MAVKWLFLDMNAYFASVEQQENRSLRGRPIAVVPMLADHTCCIAASYEAKAYGVKTGTTVLDARRLCPNIELVPAHVNLYRDYHDEIVKVVQDCVPVTKVLSVDEMVCRLWKNDSHLADALGLGAHIKNEIRRRAGDWLQCSVGLGENAFLAKVAAELQKPNGLSVIDGVDLPHKLHGMRLRDWPGIATGMERRLNRAGVTTTEQMYGASEAQMRAIWGGINGERWWHMIRGHQVNLAPTRRGQVGHSHVLSPEMRTEAGARAIAARLLEKAAERMRFLGYHTRRLAVQVRSYDEPGWCGKVRFAPTRDTFTLMDAMGQIWQDGVRRPSQVQIALYDVVADMDVVQGLFEDPRDRMRLDAVDEINRRYGRGTVTIAAALPAAHTAQDKIAFGKVHELQ